MSDNRKIAVLITDAMPLTAEQTAEIEALGYEVTRCGDTETLPPEEAARFEVVLGFKFFTKNALEHFKNLKFLQCIATGIENVPVEQLKGTGILVSKGKDLYSIPMAEWAVWRLLQHYKKGRDFARWQEERRWVRAQWVPYDSDLDDLYGKTVGIIGTGDIAAALCRLLRGFEVEAIYGINSNGRPLPEYDACYTPDQLKELAAKSDILVSLAPLTDATRDSINAEVLSCMKDGSVLVSLSRGGVVVTEDVIAALDSGKLGAFLADVVKEEPIKADNPLWEMDNVYLTPHNSFISDQRSHRLFALMRDNLAHYAAGEPIEAVVDLSKGY
ncbi:MAG: hypothetical protein IJC43_06780 [Clostridia bacterium]|nr:hypothetical protein [Clostridia bacterium]